jgi:hypothetical protein
LPAAVEPADGPSGKCGAALRIRSESVAKSGFQVRDGRRVRCPDELVVAGGLCRLGVPGGSAVVEVPGAVAEGGDDVGWFEPSVALARNAGVAQMFHSAV